MRWWFDFKPIYGVLSNSYRVQPSDNLMRRLDLDRFLSVLNGFFDRVRTSFSASSRASAGHTWFLRGATGLVPAPCHLPSESPVRPPEFFRVLADARIAHPSTGCPSDLVTRHLYKASGPFHFLLLFFSRTRHGRIVFFPRLWPPLVARGWSGNEEKTVPDRTGCSILCFHHGGVLDTTCPTSEHPLQQQHQQQPQQKCLWQSHFTGSSFGFEFGFGSPSFWELSHSERNFRPDFGYPISGTPFVVFNAIVWRGHLPNGVVGCDFNWSPCGNPILFDFFLLS